MMMKKKMMLATATAMAASAARMEQQMAKQYLSIICPSLFERYNFYDFVSFVMFPLLIIIEHAISIICKLWRNTFKTSVFVMLPFHLEFELIIIWHKNDRIFSRWTIELTTGDCLWQWISMNGKYNNRTTNHEASDFHLRCKRQKKNSCLNPEKETDFQNGHHYQQKQNQQHQTTNQPNSTKK